MLPAQLHDFIDDELMRAPLLVDQTIEAALDAIRKAMPALPPHERAVSADALQAVLKNRQHMLDAYLQSLRRQLDQQPATPPVQQPVPPQRTLALVDEDEVAADVALSRSIEAIRSTAEYELRELQTYTAALVGDMDVSRDHNPFRPEVHARALWAAAQALVRGCQFVFMRHAADPQAQLLRKSYAGAAARLEDAGIEPGAHRTLILPAGSRRPRPSSTAPLRPGVHRDVDDSSDLLARLYAAILADPLLPVDVRALLARLQPALMRAALRDPQGLDSDSHPAWRFVDRIAFIGETLPAPDDADRIQALRLMQGLVDHVVGEPDQTAAIHDWALQRLARQERNRHERRCTAALDEIALLQKLEDKLVASTAAPSTLHGTLDVSHLDTVPSQLLTLDAAPKPPGSTAPDFLRQRRPGDWLRVFLQGRWVLAQLLWPGERAEVFLLGDGASSQTWAVRRRALCTLHDERLLLPAEPRSLLRTAARRVMRRMARA